MAASEAKRIETQRLIEQNLSLVQAIARKVKRTLGASIDLEDLVGYGSKGLVEAAERFDPTHGVVFTTFAYYRIRGAMYDGLLTMGWYSRADYARYRAEERANEYLRAQADREAAGRTEAPVGSKPTPSETLESLSQALSGIAAVHIVSIEAAASVADESLPAPDASVDTGRLSKRVRDAVTTLPDKERRLMELYYFGEKTLEEAGAALGLSKSWACRLHARAVDLLRQAMGEDVD